ncbi:MAG: hypothetical protein H3C49_02475 [Alphaproteobacteria bacterium]|nr:hypothetical protein [Alphaproteobacteria bacterium]
MKKIFNWLAQKSAVQPTLGYVLGRPFLGPSDINRAIYNTANLKNGGRIVERGIFLASIFGAVAAVPAATPALATAFLVGGAVIAGKTVGVLAGKVADFLIEDINSRVIPRREAAKAQKNQPKP